MLPVKKIITTTDFSEAARKGVDAAAELAHTFDADLLLVHVSQPLQTAPAATAAAGYHLPTVDREIRKEASQLADELVASAVPDAVRSQVRILEGKPAQEIADLAAKEGADLIVIATRGEATWKKVLFGSVAEAVVRHAECPVLTVPATEASDAS
ncbi:MAG TPA: universal stress protein [Desulfosarcina sp.]|nr:universal stress protein [Desulfosarcina sp.]